MKEMSYWYLVFFLFSILGYFAEVIYCFIISKKIINRGFMHGPYCPIYGVGTLAILILLKKYYNDPVVIFVFGFIICSIIEYITSYLLEKLFKNKWWDYSNRKCNINGRVCLRNSILFGLSSLSVIYILYPLVSKLIKLVNIKLVNILALIFFIIFITDLIITIVEANKLKKQLGIIYKIKNEITIKIPTIIQKKVNDALKVYKTYPKRFIKAFPNIKYKHESSLNYLSKAFKKNNKK